MQWQSCAITDTGKVRKLNEDSIFQNDQQHIWAVADGMGGHHRGDLASQTVVKQLHNYCVTQHSGIAVQSIDSLLHTANAELVGKAAEIDSGIIATTAAVLTCSRQSIICSWVGDSRVYRYREGCLTQLTRDHSYESILEDLRNKGESVEHVMVDTQTLTRGVGAESELIVEHCMFQVNRGDRYLICTDGLYKEVSDVELRHTYNTIHRDQELLEKLHHDYLSAGARDNLGLILLTAT
ncbi:MAG: protein phosphatase 2C domain-containing protein [Pseudomonadota bacterium]